MSNLKPLVTENPEGNYQFLYNMTCIKDKEVYMRGMIGKDGDMSLVDYCKQQCKEKCDTDLPDVGAEEFAEYMDCDCIVSIFYAMAIGHAELRLGLGLYEETGLSPDEAKERTCEYSEKEELWGCSECDAEWTFIDGGPEENHLSFCPQCGRKVVAWIKHVSEDDDEGEFIRTV